MIFGLGASNCDGEISYWCEGLTAEGDREHVFDGEYLALALGSVSGARYSYGNSSGLTIANYGYVCCGSSGDRPLY
jgi:hypothetical protein